MRKRDLSDTLAVLDWLRSRAKKLNLDAGNYDTQVRALATAELASRADRPGYFEACMRNQKWHLLSDADLFRAKRRLADHFAGSMPGIVNDLVAKLAVRDHVPVLDEDDDE